MVFFGSRLKRCLTTVSGNSHAIGYLAMQEPVPYGAGLAMQDYLVKRRQRLNAQGGADAGDDTPLDLICFLGHPPTYTVGRRSRSESETEDEARLKRLGAAYFETMRGGQITFHGPGQLVAYPILDIRDYELNVRCFVSRLEQTIIDTCHEYGVQTQRTSNTGVWVGEEHKIAALGVHLQRYVSSHGLALNCDTDLAWFDQIVPCGLHDKSTTSLSEQLGRRITPDQVLPKLIHSFEKQFGKPLVDVSLGTPVARDLEAILARHHAQGISS